ncbi:egg-specific protein precursor [Bombyx mori]|uniref:Egg-specific protein n=1 Tax=Bombyx mori TaxID=7091 RepID=Q17219_BOMMO|nr:egg-specific protein precursor [Bombyx mori]BAA02091.1 egg-specific protein precursor [Bombyx mori]
MKTIYALLCLTLVQSISCSIFMTKQHSQDDIIQHPLDYVEQQIHQQKQKLQKQTLNKRSHQHSDSDSDSASRAAASHSASQSSSSQSSSSQEDEAKHVQDKMNVKHHSPVYSVIMKLKKEVDINHGDSVVWKNIEMASGPNSPVQTEQDIEDIFGDSLKTWDHFTDDAKKNTFHDAISETQRENNEDFHLNATELLKKHQYPVEEHTVATDDGYHLTVLRIPPTHQTRDDKKKPVALLMHGLLGSADDWLLMGPSKSLAYMLSDAGYDVWLGNVRGNKYSRSHVSKHPALNDFWKFSNDEIALHDLPAIIDHVLDISGQERLHYIGHSQGATTFFALMSEQPSYNEKIVSMHALSPIVYMNYVRSPLFRMIAPTSKFYQYIHDQVGHGAFEPGKHLIETFGGAACREKLGCRHVCNNLNYVISGINVYNQDADIVPVVMAHLPAGTSARVMKQYGQNVASHDFRKYNYGAETNMKVYGASEPPSYDLSKVSAPVNLYHSHDAWLAHPKDVEKLQENLPNVKQSFEVPEQQHFTDLDFQFSKKAPDTVYQKLMENMQNNS